jgi:hypothetical protein
LRARRNRCEHERLRHAENEFALFCDQHRVAPESIPERSALRPEALRELYEGCVELHRRLTAAERREITRCLSLIVGRELGVFDVFGHPMKRSLIAAAHPNAIRESWQQRRTRPKRRQSTEVIQ